MNINKLAREYMPSKKYTLSGVFFFAIRWALSVLFFDILDLPAWFWTVVISGIIFILAHIVYKEWVYKKDDVKKDTFENTKANK